jgi:N-acetylneuraminic acid mutarotase
MKRKTLFNPIMILSLLLASVGSLIRPSIAFADDGGTWTPRANMPTAREALGVAAAVNGKLYAIGGEGGGSTVEEYDPTTDTWMARASMPTARVGLGVVAASNGKLYAIGGYSGSNLSTVEEYNPATNTWTARASMPSARQFLGVAAAPNGRLYAIGGSGNGGDLSTVEEYNPATDTWTTRTSMPTARERLGIAAASNGKIYAIGGFANNTDTLSTVEEYDPATDTWLVRANMPTARRMVGVAAANGKIYAIGGASGSPLATVEEYDPMMNTWAMRASMPTASENLGVAVATNGKLYAIGGYNWSSGIISAVQEFTPPSARMVATTASSEVYPGDTVSVALNLQSASNLYAAQAVCSVDPAILQPQSGTLGDFFDPVNRLIGANHANPTAGTWIGAISQRSPALPLFGYGIFATVNYQASGPGTTTITCDPLLSDRDGFTQLVTYTGTSVTVLPFATISGIAKYQGRLVHAGITVTATGSVTRTATTNSTGNYTITQLKGGGYNIQAAATGYLPNCTTIINVTTLPDTVLKGGDANNDGAINIGDATLVAANFGLQVPPADVRADINGDVKVNIQDLAILGGNYSLSGCQVWH